MFELRDYQLEAVNSVFGHWQENAATLIVAATGCGKTVLMCEIIRRVFPRRVMILAHREELIYQARDKVQRFAGVNADIEMGELRANEDAGLFGKPRVVVSTIQTQTAGGDGMGRMGRFDPWEFEFLIVDEAHHATADSYRRVLDYYRQNENLRVLGVTATPDRADEEALGQVFDTVAYEYEILDAIRDGYLVPVRQQLVSVGSLDYSSIHTTAGDLNGRELSDLLTQEENLHAIAFPTLEIAGNRKTLVFTSSVDHAERLCEILNRHRMNSATWICGRTPKDERRDRLAAFDKGQYQFCCNVGCLTEGYDCPGIELVVMGRPTKSRALYAQMVGRGTRPLPGVIEGLNSVDRRVAAIAHSAKPHVTILDFVGNSGRHKLMTTADILGGNESDEVVQRARERVEQDGSAQDMQEALEAAREEIEAAKRKEALRRARITVRASYHASSVDPFDVFDIRPTCERGWERGKQLSPKQRDLLLRQGIDPDDRTYYDNKQVLDELFRRWDEGLCSYKQARLLRKYGFPGDVSRDQAQQIISRIAANRWRPVRVREVMASVEV
jgi:superfamily II DNA or RNA helicase